MSRYDCELLSLKLLVVHAYSLENDDCWRALEPACRCVVKVITIDFWKVVAIPDEADLFFAGCCSLASTSPPIVDIVDCVYVTDEAWKSSFCRISNFLKSIKNSSIIFKTWIVAMSYLFRIVTIWSLTSVLPYLVAPNTWMLKLATKKAYKFSARFVLHFVGAGTR